MTSRSLPAQIYGFLLLGFVAVATTLGGVLTFVGNPDPLANEKRRLAQLEVPRDLAQWGQFPKKFDVFFGDNFGFRQALIRLDSKIALALLGRSPSDNVLLGRDKWLYFAGEHSIELYQNALPLSEGDLDLMRQRIAGRRDRLAARGIGYAFAIAPDKHTIYPEFMPRRILRKQKPSQYSQVLEMAKAADLPVVDLRSALLAAKPTGQLYLRDDTHWNDLGVSVALPTLFAAMRPKIDLSAPPLSPDDFEMKPIKTGDLAEMALISRDENAPVLKKSRLPCAFEVTEKNWDSAGRRFFTRTHCPSARKKLLFIHDSFGQALAPRLAAEFGDMVAVWVHPTDAEFDALVEREKPDFVLEERAERYLSSHP
ncbi:alginate O-acetyltransferase [Rhodoblastus sp.]|uniref:alginate O-acetyltransferase AlgX-related protein n=1 Tax=Rhodoblastus sp. TaxID=1962975 RepID=UPI0035B1C9C4